LEGSEPPGCGEFAQQCDAGPDLYPYAEHLTLTVYLMMGLAYKKELYLRIMGL